MVSEKFMDILHQQPHYSKPSTSSNSSKISSDIQKTVVKIKEENEDVTLKENEDTIIIKSENITVKEEEVDGNDWKPRVPQTMKSEIQELPLDKAPKDKAPKDDEKKNFSSMCVPLPQLMKDKQGLRPPSKRIRRKKIIYDPSVASNDNQSQREEISCKIEYDISSISETDNSCSEASKEDTVTKCKENWAEELTCEYCGKYMQRPDYLRLHLMKHTGETPHKCPHCNNGYRARWRLAQHLRTHTKHLPYHCPYCNYTGNRSDYLTSHVKRIHKNRIKDYEKRKY